MNHKIWDQVYHCWCRSHDNVVQKEMIQIFNNDFEEQLNRIEKVNINKNGLLDLEEDDEDDIE